MSAMIEVDYPSYPHGRVVTYMPGTKNRSVVFLTREKDRLYYVWILQPNRRLRWDAAFLSRARAMKELLVVASKARR